MKNWQNRITISPEVMGGRPVIKGTRMPVQTVIAYLAGGESVETICEQFELEEDDVRAALAYAAFSLDGERAHALPS
jgi:uncharacterized protein (DUF433 family)